MSGGRDGCGWVFLLVPAYPGCPGQKAVCVCVFMCLLHVWPGGPQHNG